MLFKNLGFVVGMLLLLATAVRAEDNTTKKLTRRCKDNERRALLDFKDGLVDEYGILSSWGNKSNEEECCNWKGIRCSNRTGHVILLNLPRDPSGMMSSWGNYTDAQLTGNISPSLSELKHLKYLNLNTNGFRGEIPPQLGNLTNLHSLDLGMWSHGGYNTLTVENLDWVSNFHLLTHLDLAGVDLSSCNDWLNQIYKLSSLSYLHLNNSHLPDPLLPINTTSYTASNSLAVIDLSYNNLISAKSYNWLFNFTTTLVDIDLSWNSFSRSEFPEAFGRIMFLESLILSVCRFEGMLPDSFRNLSRLATLDVAYNYFNRSLSEFLHPLATNEKNSIQVLYLQDNQLYGSLPDYLTRFTSLREMSISSNQLSGSFPDSFRQLSSSLVHIDLSYNQINGPFPDDYWQQPSSLVHLDLSYNQITGLFPDNFWQVSSSLVHLDLSNNQITGPLPNLTLFSSLEILILSNNKLEGLVPEAYFSNLPKLTILDLSSNSLTFNFSFGWLPPFQLNTLLLENCSLGPHFPNWITSQPNITELDISHARISDTIPLQFWDLSPQLSILNMSNNQIQGILPNISVTLPYDRLYIDLSNNRLRGPIPSFPLSLNSLDLSHNRFTGSLSFICTGPYEELYSLDLSHNKLSGDLVANCFMNSNQLTTLYLGNNDFSGNIPKSIGLLDQLAILQLHNNKFTGQLPLSMMNFTNLELLDLSENKLSGKVPSWIGTSLTSLAVLSLRNNEFSGSIPPQICCLGFAQVLDLSQNNLTGSIPHCINNLTSLVEKETNNQKVDEYATLEPYPAPRPPVVGVQWKGVSSEYERTLKYLKLIDLSSNRLVGEIPMAFASLTGLISLNLSLNSLTGNIIPKIGQMKNLESLDLSRNNLSGEIPFGLANLTLLSVLDLSNNNLKGEIPKSTQLQSFDPAKYAGNEHLCGLPLLNKCGGVHSLPTGHDDKDTSNEEGDDNFPKFWLYASAALGFGTGFWGFIGPIMLQRMWRHSYYKWLGNITDRICVTSILHLTRLRRRLHG